MTAAPGPCCIQHEALRKAEGVSDRPGCQFCPVCMVSGWYGHPEHAPDCLLARALAAPCGAKDQEQVATQARSPEREKEREKEEKQPRSRSDVDPPGFQEFWNAYPRKVGKGAARRAWSKLHGKHSEILPAALASLAWQRVSPDWTKESGAFIPHPATYLNQERWTDQPIEKPPDPFLTWVEEEESLARH